MNLGSDKVTRIYACQLATSNSVKQHKLRKTIAWLSDKEGLGKEFLSLYLPPTASITQTVATLKSQSKSDTRRNGEVWGRFQDSSKNLIRHLNLKKELPETGLAVFAGTFTVKGEGEVSTVEELVPPQPVAAYLLEVDNHFHLEPLREMLRNPQVVGLLAMDSKQASFGLLNGESLEFLKDITSGVSGKSGKGGQSQRRYERERDMELSHFFHRVAEHAAKAFLEDHEVTALIVGGPGTTKADFLKGDYLHYELQNALVNTVDIQSADRAGVREVFERSAELLKNLCTPEERMAVHRLLAELAKQTGLATYGLGSVLDALRNGEAEVALVTDSTGFVEVGVLCKKCGLSKTQIMDSQEKAQKVQEMLSGHCERCKAADFEVKEKDIVDVLEDAASQTDARVEVIATESDEKMQLTALGGIAALLRYRT